MINNIVTEYDDTPSIFQYIPNFITKEEESKLKAYLDSTNDFIPSITHNFNISRLQKWYQVDKKYFCPLWKERYPHWTSFEIDDTVSNLINKVQVFVNEFGNEFSSVNNLDGFQIPKINSCLINKYPTGENFIAPHRDSAISFGETPTIIGLSIGNERKINFIRNDKTKIDDFSFNLESGSIFIMAGSSQKYYQHTIPKEYCDNVRYSLTFREFIL
jgi:alkylated DNA repair dioxygenase AlkB